MAHRKAGGTAKNLRDSNPKYLGIKLYDGETARAGSIIVRQRGTKIAPGAGTDIGKDHTIFAKTDGRVKFGAKRKTGFDHRVKIVRTVSVKAK